MRYSFIQRTTLLLICLASMGVVSAQSIKDVRINEILVYNTDGLRDSYGQTTSWIELYNAGYGKVNVGGGYLRIDGKEYRIPQGDPRTVIPSQGYLVFYAGGDPQKGTFHTNFTLEESDYIVFCDTENKNRIIDSLYYDRSRMVENISYGWFDDHDGVIRLVNLPASTPGATNNTLDKTPRSEIFRQADPSGVVITITAITVVGIALTMLYLIFKSMGKSFIRVAQRNEEKVKPATSGSVKDISKKDKDYVMTKEEVVAIATAIYKYSEDLHDIENTVLTINRVTKAYSPWSSKIYGVSQSSIMTKK